MSWLSPTLSIEWQRTQFARTKFRPRYALCLRILAIVDAFTRQCLALPDTLLPNLRVARKLDDLIAVRGRPTMCVSDNGTELTGMAILAGRRRLGSSGITSRPASRSRMPSWRASRDGCATSS